MPKKLPRSRTPFSTPVRQFAASTLKAATAAVDTEWLIIMTQDQIRELEALGEDATVLKQTLQRLQDLRR